MQQQIYFANRALLPDSWAEQVRFEVQNGVIKNVTTNANSKDCIHLDGPVLPTMPNLHSHAFQRVMAGMAEVSRNPDDSFWSWRELMYRIVRQLTPDDVRVIATKLYIDMLKGGYSQVAEFHYLHHQPNGQPYPQINEMAQQLFEAADIAGIGITMLPVLYSHSNFGGEAPTEGQRRFLNNVDQYLILHSDCSAYSANSPLHKTGICFHSLRAATPEQIKEVMHSLPAKQPIHIHIAEQQKEVQDCLQWSGQRPVEWLAENIGLDKRWCLIHATHLNESEITAVAQSQAVAGLCPTTEANLGDGIFPATDFISQRGCWGIGSDSHVSLSIVEELRTLEYGQRLRDQQRNRLYSCNQNNHIGDTLYQQALLGGNQATDTQLDLAAGCRADFMVLDSNHPFVAASKSEDLLNRWLFATNENLIRHVYVAGRPVIFDFRHMVEERANAEFVSLLKRLF